MRLRNWIIGTAAAAMLAGVGCGGIGKAQTQLRSAIDAKKPTLDGCYERALERNETAAGTMTVWVHVAEKGGSVTKAELESSTVDDDELRQCVESTLVGTQISPPPKANLKVEYRLEFSPST